MLEALIITAGLGFLLGLRYRAPALVVASAGAVVAGPAIAYFTGSPFWAVLVAPAAALVALQCGYLGGLLLNHTVMRAKPGRDAEETPKGCVAAEE